MKKGKVFFALAACLILLLSSVSGAGARDKRGDLQRAMQSLRADEEISVIITLSDKADLGRFADRNKGQRRTKILQALREKAEQTQGPLRAFLDIKRAKHIRPLWIINGVAATVSAGTVRELERFPGVESISLDYALSAPVVTYGSTAAPEWNLSAIHAPELWNAGYTGQGAVVANMDTGVDADHPDLQSRWRGGSNSWYDPNGEHSVPYDANGHGTQAMGLAVGGDAGGTAIGTAPGARWIAVKIFNDAGTASYSFIHQGFQWLLDPDYDSATNDAPDAVIISWGLNNVNSCDPEFQPDIQALRAADIFSAFAAGNDGPNPATSVSPANYPESFATGAVDELLVTDSSSGRGPSACDGDIYPELVAPGVNVKTTDLTFGGLIPDSYAFVSGTSFAAPHVAGAAALLLSASPGLTVGELETALKNSATDLGVTGPDNDFGYGLVNISGAFSALTRPDISATPAALDFGSVLMFRTRTLTETMSNIGSANLTVSNIQIVGTNASMFQVTNWAGPKTIDPGGSSNLSVVFRPTSRGVKAAVLRITSNDPDTPVLDIPLSGTGR